MTEQDATEGTMGLDPNVDIETVVAEATDFPAQLVGCTITSSSTLDLCGEDSVEFMPCKALDMLQENRTD